MEIVVVMVDASKEEGPVNRLISPDPRSLKLDGPSKNLPSKCDSRKDPYDIGASAWEELKRKGGTASVAAKDGGRL